jgi:hypothetical protein
VPPVPIQKPDVWISHKMRPLLSCPTPGMIKLRLPLIRDLAPLRFTSVQVVRRGDITSRPKCRTVPAPRPGP